ncbi:MAG: excinuclease ABC subunit A, partial [Bacteroidales bacterium]|nr:excinuclease ABC subunit A [Bacteroidales bacterium]
MAAHRKEQKEENVTESKRCIELRGVRVNNLKNVNLKFPAGRLVVVTGLSGSGKSSLVFDTLYAEGQRRYVESLSAYARQFLGRMSKPEVDFISGLAPAIAIEQKSLSKNPRSTVGTVTEIYEYLKLLYARIGRLYSPVSGREVRRHSVSHVTDFVCSLSAGLKVYVLSPLRPKPAEGAAADFHHQEVERLKVMGFSRLYDYETSAVCGMDDVPVAAWRDLDGRYGLLVDRFVVHPEDKSFYSRVFDSVQTAFNEGNGRCRIVCEGVDRTRGWSFSNHLEADGMTFVKPSPNFFAFNNPYGACKTCGGTGQIVGESEELVIPNPSLSVYENAVACWRGDKMSAWKEAFMRNAAVYDFPVHRPYKDLDRAQKKLLWKGGKGVKGID